MALKVDAEAWYRADEIAEQLGVSKKTLAQKRVQGSGPEYMRHGNRIMYRGADVLAWMESCRKRSTSDPSNGPDTRPHPSSRIKGGGR